jgi:hypothetical protein
MNTRKRQRKVKTIEKKWNQAEKKEVINQKKNKTRKKVEDKRREKKRREGTSGKEGKADEWHREEESSRKEGLGKKKLKRLQGTGMLITMHLKRTRALQEVKGKETKDGGMEVIED